MSSPRTTVHLLRHGEVENPSGVLYGRLPGFHLSAAGRDMADLAAAALQGHDVVLLVTSPLERTRETARPLAEEFGLTPQVDDRLIEAASAFQGLAVRIGDASLLRPVHWLKLRNPLRPSWGEPYEQVATRMIAAVESARAQASGHEAVLVSHQLPIWTVRRSVEGRRLWHRPDRRQCGLASLTSLTYDGDRLVRVTYTEPAGALARKPVTPGA